MGNTKKLIGESSKAPTEDSACYIHDLPNEILVSIFTYLKPKELLYGVGMVCKRWHEVSRDSQAWQKVSFSLWDDRRIWRNAPVIGHLEILAPNESEVEKVRHLVDSPGPSCVRSVRIIIRNPKDTLGILKKYQKSIRTLDLQVGGQDARPEEWQSFFDAIGMLTDLRSLSLRISPNSTEIPYNQQISAGCPVVRYLRVRGQETIASDLLRDLGRVVTSLSISCSFSEHSLELIEAMAACTAVEEVSLPCSMFSALAQIPSLKTVKLIADRAPTSPEQAVLLASPTLKNVERLDVCTSRTQVMPDVGLNKCIAMMAPHLTNCRIVDFRGLQTLDEYLSEFIHEAKKVQSYDLCCRVYHLLQFELSDSVNNVRAVLDNNYAQVPFVANVVSRLTSHPNKKFDIHFSSIAGP